MLCVVSVMIVMVIDVDIKTHDNVYGYNPCPC
jgi:hypothetical protein